MTQPYGPGPGGPQYPQQPPYGFPPPPQGYPPQQPGVPLGYASPMPMQGSFTPGMGRIIDIGQIARRQRAIMYCLLVYIGLIVAYMMVQVSSARGGRVNVSHETLMVSGVISICMMCAMVVTTVFVFRLALSMYDQGIGILLGILTLIPCVGLIFLLVVNGKATGILKRHGISVGLMGANTRQMPPIGTMSTEFPQPQQPFPGYPLLGGYPPR